jgi:hypothetical protein
MALGNLVPLSSSGPAPAGVPQPGVLATPVPVSVPPVPSVTSVAPVVSMPPLAELERAAQYVRAQGRVRCKRRASGSEMTLLLVYLVVATAFTLYSLYCFWPRPTPNEQAPPSGTSSTLRDSIVRETGVRDTVAPGREASAYVINPCDATASMTLPARVVPDSVRAQMTGVCYLNRPYIIWKERQLLLLVLLAGAVGGLLSGMRKSTQSYYKNNLCAEGLPGLYVWPLSASLVGLVFYVVIRGGFFSGQSTVSQTSTYSFIATALLAGMFTHEAYGKLKQIAETVLTRVDSKPLELPSSAQSPATTSARARSSGQTTSVAAASVDGGGGERGTMPSVPALPMAAAVTAPPGTVG